MLTLFVTQLSNVVEKFIMILMLVLMMNFVLDQINVSNVFTRIIFAGVLVLWDVELMEIVLMKTGGGLF